MTAKTAIRLSVALAALASAPAIAHPFHGAGDLSAGLVHPFLGLDHLLAMLAVGLWAAQLGGRALWAVPSAFVLAMLAGFGLGFAGYALPGVEPMIAASVLLFGLLAAARARLPATAGMLVAGAFALSHGFAHSVEIPVGGAAVSFAFGLACATAALHALGLLLGRSLRARYAGVPIAFAGVLMLLQPALA